MSAFFSVSPRNLVFSLSAVAGLGAMMVSSNAATLVVGGSDPDWVGDMDGLTKVDGAGDIFVNSTQNSGTPTGGIRNQARFADNNGDWWNVVDVGGNNVFQRGPTQEDLDRGSGFLFDSPNFSQAQLSLDHNFGSVDGTQWASMTFKVWGFTSETATDNIKGDWSQIEGSAGDLDLLLDVSLTDPNTAGSGFTSVTFDTTSYVAIGFSAQAVTVGGNQSPTGAYPYIDNVQISQIPEPAAPALLLMAGVGLLISRRRDRG